MESLPTSTSTIIRKPWGGQLEAAVLTSAPGDAGGRFLELVHLHLRKLAEIALLATLLAVPLIYHLSLQEGAVYSLREFFGTAEEFTDQLEPYFTGMMPVLETKFSAWAILGTLTIAAYLALRLFEGLLRTGGLLTGADSQPSSRTLHRFGPLLAIALFLVYALASFLLWPPTVPGEARELAGGMALSAAEGGGYGAWAASLGGGGLFYSIVAWLQVGFALFFFLVCEDLIRERSMVTRILGLLVLTGVINAFLVILLKVGFGPLLDVWVRFGPNESRNQLGALIGHNTGVSSFLLAPLLVTIMWVVTLQPRRMQLLRVALSGCVLVMALAMLLTQSRAVLPIAIGMTLMMLAILYRRSCMLPRSRLYVWFPVLLGFILLTQLVPSRFNPLYRQDVTLVERVGEFRPQRLLTETRLRILAVSVYELIPEAPVLGHGFATFQYVYPRAQGRYFERFERSRLAPTHLRTQRGHNEYLQILIETGIVGLAIALGGLVLLLRGGWGVLQRTLMPHHISVQAAVLAAILGLLLHCLVDFPLRVPPLALTLVFLLAIWSAGDRLWIFPMKPPVEDDEPIPGAVEPARRAMTRQRRRTLALLSSLGGIVALGLLLTASSMILVRSVSRYQSAATLLTRGEYFLRAFNDNRSNTSFLRLGGRDLYWAKRIFWISGPINRLDGQARYFEAQLSYRNADLAAAEELFETAASARGYAHSLATAALTNLNMALSEERFHSMYLLRSSIHHLIASNSLDEDRARHHAMMMEDLYRAVSMNPGDPNAMFSLIQHLERDPVLNRGEIVRHLGRLHHFHRVFFDREAFSRVLDARALGEHEEAFRRMTLIAEAVPDSLSYRLVLAATALSAGELERARDVASQILETIRDTDNFRAEREAAMMILIEQAIRSGDLDFAIRNLTVAERFLTVPESHVQALRLYILAESGENPDEQEARREEILELGNENPIHLQTAGYVAFEVFGNASEAIWWLERRRAMHPPAADMDTQGYVILARAYLETENWEGLEEMLPILRGREGTAYGERLARVVANELEERMNRARGEVSANGAGS